LIHQYDRFSDISKKIRDKFNNDNNLTISSNEFYDNNNFVIYFFVLLAILFFCIILVIISFRYFFNKCRKIKASISQKQLNKFKAVKIEKSMKKRKGKFTRDKWNIVLNYTDN
jgi:ATP-dependent Zn protease